MCTTRKNCLLVWHNFNPKSSIELVHVHLGCPICAERGKGLVTVFHRQVPCRFPNRHPFRLKLLIVAIWAKEDSNREVPLTLLEDDKQPPDGIATINIYHAKKNCKRLLKYCRRVPMEASYAEIQPNRNQTQSWRDSREAHLLKGDTSVYLSCSSPGAVFMEIFFSKCDSSNRD